MFKNQVIRFKMNNSDAQTQTTSSTKLKIWTSEVEVFNHCQSCKANIRNGVSNEYLGGGFKYFLFAPLFGEDFQVD